MTPSTCTVLSDPNSAKPTFPNPTDASLNSLMQNSTTHQNLLGLDETELTQFFVSLGEKPFRAKQVLQWIHQRSIIDFEKMTDLSKSLQAKLKSLAIVAAPNSSVEQCAQDGTRKWLLRLEDGNQVETVFIPEKNRGTLCVSSQVGCMLTCRFCSTAKQGFSRNLTAAEIIGQVWFAKKRLAELGPFQDLYNNITNVVMMGMGEPLLNFEPVVKALSLMRHDLAYGLSKRRVTVSTSGVVPNIDRLNEAADVALAVSLHAPNDDLRSQLVPLNKKYPISELMAACKRYCEKDARRKITIEYVMLEAVNDTVDHAKQLAKLLRELPCKINLIPFNPFAGTEYVRSKVSAIEQFKMILLNAGYITTVRKTRGMDIDAACGQLKGRVMDKTLRSKRWASNSAAKTSVSGEHKCLDIRVAV